MIAGGSLSPLLGAVMLTPLDKTMEAKIRKGHVWYIRYMDDLAIQTIIITAVKYSEGLSTDIKIGEGADGYNGFWRSFNPYVSNQVLTLSCNMERWSSNQKQPGYPVAGNNPIHYAKQTLLSLDSYF